MRRPRYWIDGEVVDNALVPADDRGLLYGDGLFETILVSNGRPVWLSAHLARFRRSARALGFSGPDRLAQAGARAARDLLKGSAAERAALRITWTRGSGAGGFAPKAGSRIFARLAPLTAPRKGVRAIFYPDLQAGSMAAHKTCSAMVYVEAARRARATGADEALLSDGQGGIAEASAANLFAVIDGVLITPPARLPLLPGITRAWVIRQAASMRLRFRERAIRAQDLARAEDVFLTGSLAGVVPLRTLDGRRVGNIGALTKKLASAFAREAGL